MNNPEKPNQTSIENLTELPRNIFLKKLCLGAAGAFLAGMGFHLLNSETNSFLGIAALGVSTVGVAGAMGKAIVNFPSNFHALIYPDGTPANFSSKLQYAGSRFVGDMLPVGITCLPFMCKALTMSAH